jgi:hypothetical protein
MNDAKVVLLLPFRSPMTLLGAIFARAPQPSCNLIGYTMRLGGFVRLVEFVGANVCVGGGRVLVKESGNCWRVVTVFCRARSRHHTTFAHP